MKIADQKLLLEYARLQLGIARARVVGMSPEGWLDIAWTDAFLRKTVGYRKLREFFLCLSHFKRAVYRKQLRSELDAVAKLQAKAKATGEELNLAEIEILVRDTKSGDVVPMPNPETEERDDAEPRDANHDHQAQAPQARNDGDGNAR